MVRRALLILKFSNVNVSGLHASWQDLHQETTSMQMKLHLPHCKFTFSNFSSIGDTNSYSVHNLTVGSHQRSCQERSTKSFVSQSCLGAMLMALNSLNPSSLESTKT